MPDVVADKTAAFISYSDGWEGRDGTRRVARTPGACALLRFAGSAFSLYGELSDTLGQPGGSSRVSVAFDHGNATLVGDNGNTGNQPLYTRAGLDSNRTHTVNITVESGTFSLERVVWTSSGDYQLRDDIRVNQTSSSHFVTQPSNAWVSIPPDDLVSSMCTWTNGANITFWFRGNGIAIQGRGSPWAPGTTFRVLVDNKPTNDELSAYAPANLLIDLYRNDTLTSGNHSVTLVTTRSEQFCVTTAQMFDVTPASGSTVPPTAGATLPTSPQTLSGGQLAGVVIAALMIPLLIILGVLFYLSHRRRAGSPQPYQLGRTLL